MGNLTPPGSVFILYGFLAEQSIGQIFLVGIVPGIVYTILFVLFMLYIFFRAVAQPNLFPKTKSIPIEEKLKSLRMLILPTITVLLVLGGIYVGFTTPTEAGTIGAFLALLTVALKRRLTWSLLKDVALATVNTTSMVCLILAVAYAMSTVVAYIQLPSHILSAIAALHLSRWVLLAVLWLFYTVLGMFLDPGSMVVLTLPIVISIIESLGFYLIWFGVVMTMFAEMAMITPPVGFSKTSITPEKKLNDLTVNILQCSM